MSGMVVIVEHAAERAALRAGIGLGEIRADVLAALSAGRCDTRRPPFLGYGKDAQPGRRFAWDGADTRAFVIEGPSGDVVKVLTMLTSWRTDFVAEQGASAFRQAFERARRAA
jgi:hypothetical protein